MILFSRKILAKNIYIYSTILCAICYNLKNVKKTLGKLLLLEKLQGSNVIFTCFPQDLRIVIVNPNT